MNIERKGGYDIYYLVEISQNFPRGLITNILDRPAFSGVRLRLGLAWYFAWIEIGSC
jgi:hypothetical protein